MVFVIGLVFAYARRRYGLAFGLSGLTILGGAAIAALTAILPLISLSSALSVNLGAIFTQSFIYGFIVRLIALPSSARLSLIASRAETRQSESSRAKAPPPPDLWGVCVPSKDSARAIVARKQNQPPEQ